MIGKQIEYIMDVKDGSSVVAKKFTGEVVETFSEGCWKDWYKVKINENGLFTFVSQYHVNRARK